VAVKVYILDFWVMTPCSLYLEDGDNRNFWNLGTLIPDCTTSHLRRQ